MIDEASTLADRDLDAIMTMATRTGAALRLIGDPAQHGAIAAGGMFRVLCERNADTTPELTTTYRMTRTLPTAPRPKRSERAHRRCTRSP